MDNGVFHHRRSIGPSAASAKTCSTGCSMVQSSLAPSKKMRALYTAHIGFNLHNMDKMSISNHVSAVDHSVRISTASNDSNGDLQSRGRHIFWRMTGSTAV